MVVVGETDVELDATGVTEPTALSIVKVVAFVVVHESVDGEPSWMEVGEAEMVQVGGAGGGGNFGVTVIVVLHVIDPSEPRAVPVYVVVIVGETVTEPAGTGVTAPTPLLMENEVELIVVHESVEEEPSVMVGDEAESVQSHASACDGARMPVVKMKTKPKTAFRITVKDPTEVEWESL